MQELTMRRMFACMFAFMAAALIAVPQAGAVGRVVEPEADEVPLGTGGIPPPPGAETRPTPELSNAPGSNVVTPTAPDVGAECLPASSDCPVEEASGESVITTDSLPLGSTVKRANGPTVDESEYPTSVGSGSTGSGVTGTITGPDPGPTFGTGR